VRVIHAVRSDGFAGVERHVCVLAAAQVARGHDVTVIGGDERRMVAAIGSADVTVLPGNTVASVALALSRTSPGADLIHAHMTAAELAAAVAALRPGPNLPLISTRHFAARRGRTRLGRLAGRFIESRLAAQIAISQYVADHIEGGSEVVYPGVMDNPGSERPRSWTVLVVQRLEPEKRTDVALSAFAASKLADAGWRLQVVGDGSQREALQEQAARSGIAPAVDFLGSRDDVAAQMTAAGLLIAPCPIEGLGLVVLEAMAAALPVVATAAGGHLETLPPEAHDLCFEPDDVGAAATSLRLLAGDAGLRAHLGRLGHERQREKFTPQVQAEATDRVYRSVLVGSPAD